MPEKPPHILFVMVDQMRGDCLSCEDHPVLLTPNLDAMAARGTRFGRAYATCPSCIPARRSLLTGQFPATNGSPGFVGGCPIRPGTPTLPLVLRDAGYQTTLVGRDMHQSPHSAHYGYEQRIVGSPHQYGDHYHRAFWRAHPDVPDLRAVGMSFNGWNASAWPYEDELHPTAWVTHRAVEMMHDRDQTRPMFMTVSHYSPHPPLYPPAAYYQRYLDEQPPEPVVGDWAGQPPERIGPQGVDQPRGVQLTGSAWRHCAAGYFGLIQHIDDMLGYTRHHFEKVCREDDRPGLVVFCSDHGEMLGDHFMFRKCEPYEGSARVPMLVDEVGGLDLAHEQVMDSPVCLEDVMPTLLDAAGATIPDSVEGRSLLPMLRGERQSVRDLLHAEHAPCYSEAQAFQMVTDGTLKYIWRPLDGCEQLFDLSDDPHECVDLAGKPEYASALNRLRAALIDRLQDRPEGYVHDGQLTTDGERLGLLPWSNEPWDGVHH